MRQSTISIIMKYNILLAIGIALFSGDVMAQKLSIEITEHKNLCDNLGDLDGYVKVKLKNKSKSSVEIYPINLNKELPGISITFNMIDDIGQLWSQNKIIEFIDQDIILLKQGEERDFISPVCMTSGMPEYLRKELKIEKISGQLMGKIRHKNQYIYTDIVYVKNIKKCAKK